MPLSRRRFLTVSAGAGAALGSFPAAARAAGRPRTFGRYGSPAARLTPGTLYVHPGGAGDVTTVRDAVAAAKRDRAHPRHRPRHLPGDGGRGPHPHRDDLDRGERGPP